MCFGDLKNISPPCCLASNLITSTISPTPYATFNYCHNPFHHRSLLLGGGGTATWRRRWRSRRRKIKPFHYRGQSKTIKAPKPPSEWSLCCVPACGRETPWIAASFLGGGGAGTSRGQSNGEQVNNNKLSFYRKDINWQNINVCIA